MGRFNKLKNNANLIKSDILEKIMSNQALLKYVYYDSENPLEEKDINHPYELKNTHIFTKFKKFDTQTNAQTFILIRFSKGQINKVNFAYEDIIVLIDVVTHDSLIENIGEENRLFSIMDEIDNVLDGTRGKWIGRTYLQDWTEIFINDDFSGYRMVYKLSDMN